jgi:hypothetical protein
MKEAFLFRNKQIFYNFVTPSLLGDYYLTDLCGNSEKEVEDPYPIPLLTRVDGRKPALLLRFR